MKNNILSLILVLIPGILMSQAIGDYRTIVDGDWDDRFTWQTWNGTAWIQASDWPGNNNATAVTITNSITIPSGLTLTSPVVDHLVGSSGAQLSIDGTLIMNNRPINGGTFSTLFPALIINGTLTTNQYVNASTLSIGSSGRFETAWIDQDNQLEGWWHSSYRPNSLTLSGLMVYNGNGTNNQIVAANVNWTFRSILISGTAPKVAYSEGSTPLIRLQNNLTIQSGSVFIMPGNSRANAYSITVNQPEGLILRSDESFTANLIYRVFNGSGSVRIERYWPGIDGHLISCMVKDQQIDSFFINNSLTDLRRHNESSGVWSDIDEETGSLLIGRGYAARDLVTPVTLAFTGKLPNFYPDTTITVSSDYYGWNCIGNPFTSGVFTNSVITNNSTLLATGFQHIYIYRKDLAESPLYRTQNDPLTPLQYIQSGQGFFIKAASSGNFTFNKLWQGFGNNQDFYKKSSSDTTSYIILRVKDNNNSAMTAVLFRQGMTLGIDENYDAGLFGASDKLSVFSKQTDYSGIDLYLQYLPSNAAENIVIPIGLDYPAGGVVSFSFDPHLVPVNYSPVLEDRTLGIFTPLNKTGAVYQVQLNPGTKGTGRFFVHTINPNSGTGKDQSDQVFSYAVQKTIFIKGQVSEASFADLFDLTGRKVASFRLQAGNENTYTCDFNQAGIYILKVTDRNRSFTNKLFISE